MGNGNWGLGIGDWEQGFRIAVCTKDQVWWVGFWTGMRIEIEILVYWLNNTYELEVYLIDYGDAGLVRKYNQLYLTLFFETTLG